MAAGQYLKALEIEINPNATADSENIANTSTCACASGIVENWLRKGMAASNALHQHGNSIQTSPCPLGMAFRARKSHSLPRLGRWPLMNV